MENLFSAAKTMLEKKTSLFSKIGFGFLGVYAVWKMSKLVEKALLRKKLRKLIEETRETREKTIDALYRHLEAILRNGDSDTVAKWNAITRLSVPELQEMLNNGKTTAVEVLRAFQWTALKAHKATNCVTEFFMEAEDVAASLDATYGASTEKPPLFGIPISVKDNLQVKGHRSTAGMASYLDHPVPNVDAPLVAALRSLGAVPFLHTNIPQTMLSNGCSNPIFGTTGNPYDTTRIPGGSSGGEAALIALNGSVLGLGSDLGGSVRMPSHYCGTAGIKPCSSRVSRGGGKPVLQGILGIAGTWGPMARDVDSLVVMLQNIWKPDSMMFQVDPLTTPLPFQDELYNSSKPLTIGFYMGDGNLEVSIIPQKYFTTVNCGR